MSLHLEYDISDAKNIFKGLILCEMGIMCIYLLSDALGNPSYAIQKLFDMDGEACIPAWLCSIQMFLAGAILLMASRCRHPRNPSPLFLKLAGAAFIFISADEASMIHERIGTFLKSQPFVPMINGHGAWISLYLLAGLFFIVATRTHIISLWSAYRREMGLVFMGIGVFLLGALGCEIIGDIYLRTGTSNTMTPMYVLEVALEEFFEMSGLSIVLYGVMLFAMQLLRERVPAPLPVFTPIPTLPPVTPAAVSIAVPADSPMLSVAAKLPVLNNQPSYGTGQNIRPST